MYFKILFFYFFPFLFLNCNNANNVANQPQSGLTSGNLNLAKSFYKKYQGKIGDLDIVLDLNKMDSVLSGNYYYSKIGMPLSIYGTYNAKIFKLEEFDGNETTGTFEGKFDDEKHISGVWINAKTKKQLSFSLAEMTDGYVQFENIEMEKKNCKAAEAFIKDAKPVSASWDTMCSILTISQLKITSPKTAAIASINSTIEQLIPQSSNINEQQFGSIQSLIKYMDTADIDGFNEMINCDVVTNDNNILSIIVNSSMYYYGAAHPNSTSSYLNFDITNGHRITLDDIFKPNYKNVLNSIAEKIFIADYGSDGWNFESGKFTLNDNFSLHTGAIEFLFNQYEIGPYAAGMPSVIIPYSKIKHLLKPNTILSKYLNH